MTGDSGVSRWDEVAFIERAYSELRGLDREAQLRALDWLSSRLESDYEKAMEAKREAARQLRIKKQEQESNL